MNNLSGSGFCDCSGTYGMMDRQESDTIGLCYCLYNLNWFACSNHIHVHKDKISTTDYFLSVKKVWAFLCFILIRPW